jgi:hypothetical protein
MGLLHFCDDEERERYSSYCRQQRAAALERWECDGNFMDAGEADFWLLRLLEVGARP